LEADEFSGYVLAKMGATLDEAEAAMKVLATSRATKTHPAGADRIRSISVGWKNGGGISEDEDIATVERPTVNQPEYNVSPDIAATIRFNSGTEFYVTKKWNVFKPAREGTKLIARMARSNDRSYPYIIYDDTGYKLYVDRYGKIFNEDGEMLGRMRALK
jgi:hypothetical protein